MARNGPAVSYGSPTAATRREPPMRARRLPAALSALAATAVVLAGCSSSPAADEAQAERPSPLGQYLDAVYGGDLSPEEQQSQFEDQNRRVEEVVASCMQDEGFEYVPSTSSGAVYSGEENVYEPDDRDWVSQYGYGAINYPGRRRPVRRPRRGVRRPQRRLRGQPVGVRADRVLRGAQRSPADRGGDGRDGATAPSSTTGRPRGATAPPSTRSTRPRTSASPRSSRRCSSRSTPSTRTARARRS